jgi:uncharacterized protein
METAMSRHRRMFVVASLAVVSLALAPVAGSDGSRAHATPDATGQSSCAEGQQWTAYTRPAEHGTTTMTNVPIEMSDGVTLYADIVLPDAPGPFPTIVTQTAYGKDALGSSGHFAPRGYAELAVDLRGTGTSEGGWDPFSERERRDGFEVFEWVVEQEWSDGTTGGFGASYLGLTQIFSAAQQPAGLEAIFPIVPVADVYRDIVFMGGQVNAAFMPAWVGLVHAMAAAPDARYGDDPAGATEAMIERMARVADQDSTVALLARAALGDDEIVYDGPFWQERSPINHADTVEVPTFIVGGLNDLFQRGQPLLYEALRDHVDTKLLMGPWGHVDGSMAAGLEDAGLPAVEDIALRWFDDHLLGLDTQTDCIPDVTQWHWGAEEYRTQPDWPHPDLVPHALHLGDGTLTEEPPTGQGADLLPPVPVAGACSRSTNQWLMGVFDELPCSQDNRINEQLEVQYTTEPLAEDLVINGPIGARLWLEASGPEAVVVVRVTDVAPDGTSRELTNGLQVASFRELDEDRSRIVDGHNLQPWHPFTEDSLAPMPEGQPTPVDVEVFSTAAVVPEGHRVRVSIGAADVPHAVSPLPNLVETVATATQVVHGPDTPSAVVLPVVGTDGPATDPTPPPETAAGQPPADQPDDPGERPEQAGQRPGDQALDAAAGPVLPATGSGQGLVGLVLLLAGAWLLRRSPGLAVRRR